MSGTDATAHPGHYAATVRAPAPGDAEHLAAAVAALLRRFHQTQPEEEG